VSFAMALVMRQGGIVAEDADYEEKYQAQAERARTRALRIQQEKLSGGEK
jgi:cell division protein FtsL